jgi:hypothetical protein
VSKKNREEKIHSTPPPPPPPPSREKMLDINLFRKEKGGDPELVRESQRRRFADAKPDEIEKNVGLVDEVIALDEAWRQSKSSSAP